MPRRNDIAKILIIGSGPIVIGLLLLGATAARACSVFGISVPAARTFDLLVQDHGRPVAGIPIVVTRLGDKTHKALLEQKSDREGKVAIRGLQPGEYVIDNLGPIQAGELVAVVKPGGPATLSKPIAFHWPVARIVKTRRLQGTFRSADPQTPFTEMDLTLLPIDSEAPIKAAHSGADGHFDFGDMPPGVYVIQVHTKQPQAHKGWEVDGPIAAEIVPDAAAAPEHLELTLGETSCGIWYAQCPPHDPIQVSSRRILVSDPLGAVVGSAQFTLEDASGNKVLAGQSDQQGVIELPAGLRGGYKLTVYRLGFTPLEQPLELVAADPDATHLGILLNVAGTCSEAKLEKHATPQ